MQGFAWRIGPPFSSARRAQKAWDPAVCEGSALTKEYVRKLYIRCAKLGHYENLAYRVKSGHTNGGTRKFEGLTYWK